MSLSAIYTLNIGAKGTEEKRLADQHGDFLALTESLIPLSIRSHLQCLGEAPAIADVGTGTGIWLLDLAKEVPKTARLHGFDVDESKFSTELPLNINLGLANVLEPFPKELLGQYDLVHVRLLMFALKSDQWVTAAKNLLTVLKPGGYLMWDETGFTSWSCVPITESFQKWMATDIRYAQLVGRDPT
ncbi:hypothetical protein NW762_011959 [Fusarium torreyae]|uniref:Methyltransferase domain-containing protein n=1 Tax=Fusarium torreyae TaxID=1237075 RepID=A0A9W8RRC1_9HYPO|nr:hypothetical protein NW762_011959 [Fusarium torreyae]